MAWIRWPWTTGKDKADEVAYRVAKLHITSCHNVMMDAMKYFDNPLIAKKHQDITADMKKLLDGWYGEWGMRK